MGSNTIEVAAEYLPVLQVYKDGTVDRLLTLQCVPPSPADPATGVSSKEIPSSPQVSARLYLPNLKKHSINNTKLPILVNFHGGAFCVGSVSNLSLHNFLNSLAFKAQALIISVEYRLAPEHPLPASYDDCWAGLQWAASHSLANKTNKEPWLINFGDLRRIYIGGDGAGANIVHNVAMRAGVERLHGDLKIVGAFLGHPYFLGSEPLGSELPRENHEKSLLYRFWILSYPSAPGGIDYPMINPWVDGAPSLKNLGYLRMLVIVADKDYLWGRGVKYCEAVKESGWEGEMEMVDVKGEDHIFYIFKPDTEKSKDVMKRLASFIM